MNERFLSSCHIIGHRLGVLIAGAGSSKPTSIEVAQQYETSLQGVLHECF